MSVAPWISLLRAIGRDAFDADARPASESRQLYDLAYRNRIALLYLTALARAGHLNALRPELDQLTVRSHRVLGDTIRVGAALRARRIDHAIVKTLRPYPATPNDIDVLYLGRNRDLPKAKAVLTELGYRQSKEQPGQIGFWDPRRDPRHPRSSHEIDYVDVDLYKSITVKAFSYLDERLMRGHVVELEVSPGQHVSVLSPPVELAFLLFHSVFPNRHYGLEMFYTALSYIIAFSDRDRDLFARFVRANHIAPAIHLSLALTGSAYRAAFGSPPLAFAALLERLGPSAAAPTPVPVSFPYLYPLPVFLWSGIGVLQAPRLLFRFGGTVLHMANPRFLAEVLREVLGRREAEQRYKVNY